MSSKMSTEQAILYIDWKTNRAYLCKDAGQFEDFQKYQSNDETIATIELDWNNWQMKLEYLVQRFDTSLRVILSAKCYHNVESNCMFDSVITSEIISELKDFVTFCTKKGIIVEREEE